MQAEAWIFVTMPFCHFQFLSFCFLPVFCLVLTGLSDLYTSMLTSLSFFLFFTISLFFIGFFGIALNRRNVLLVLLCIEIMLLAVNLNFIIYSTFLDDFFGQLFALYVLSVAAAESAIGLALLVVYYRVQGNLSINSVNLLHGLLINININAFFFFN